MSLQHGSRTVDSGSSSIADHAPSPEGRLGRPSAYPGGPLAHRLPGRVRTRRTVHRAGSQEILPQPCVRVRGDRGAVHCCPRIWCSIRASEGARVPFGDPCFRPSPAPVGEKGAEIFTTGSYERYPERVDFITDLAEYATRLGGRLFFYGEVKPLGSPAESGETAAVRTKKALTETVRRLCDYAESRGEDLLVVLDEGGPMPREEAITAMAQFIYSSPDPKMKRILEVPMQLESHRYGSMQYADWLCAVLSRAVHFHFSTSDEFVWAPAVLGRVIQSRATQESRIWVPSLHERVSARGLSHSIKWTNRPTEPDRRRRSAHLTQRIADSLLRSS